MLAIRGAAHDNPNLKILLFFYLCCSLMIVLVWAVILCVQYPNIIKIILSINWDTISQYFPQSYRAKGKEKAVQAASEALRTTGGLTAIIVIVFIYITSGKKLYIFCKHNVQC